MSYFSRRFILFFGRFALSPRDSSDFTISRYIMYGSLNFILKKKDDPGAYGDASV